MGIARRLRSETATLHKQTERIVGLPESVTSVADYRSLLIGLRDFYASAHSSLSDERWRDGWAALRVDLDQHDRVALLDDDLRELGASAAPIEIVDFGLGSLDEALGCLYVVEGSSLGGRFLGPAMKRAVGDIPTSFYDGDGRNHPHPWRSVQAALDTYDSTGTNESAVIAGAESTFEWFGSIVAKRVAA